MRRAITGLFAALFLLTLAVPASASDPHEGNPGGNCDEAVDGYTGVKLERADFDADGVAWFTNIPGEGTDDLFDVKAVLSNEGRSVTFYIYAAGTTSPELEDAQVVFCFKASNTNSGTEVIESGETYNVDFLNEGGQTPDLSNLVVYYVIPGDEPPPPPPPSEWCSPGFWSQNPINAAAAAALLGDGKSLNSKLSEVGISYTPTKSQQRAGALADPTLAQVLAAPNVYGGGVFNAVGDLLSAASGINFTGERVEDSCPFAADASGKPPLTRN